MNKLIILSSTASLIFLATGCATARIFPVEGGNYKIITRAAMEARGYDVALNDIEKYCSVKGLAFEVISDRADYIGVDKSTKAYISLAEDANDLSAKSLDSYDDARVSIVFRCTTSS